MLELLVAVSILAVVGVIAWRGLSSLTATRDRLAPQNDDVHALLAGFGQIERDLAQVPTNVSLFALPTQAVRVFVADGQPALQILRLARSPDGSPAAAMQMVFYQVLDGQLQRQASVAALLLGREHREPRSRGPSAPGRSDANTRLAQ